MFLARSLEVYASWRSVVSYWSSHRGPEVSRQRHWAICHDIIPVRKSIPGPRIHPTCSGGYIRKVLCFNAVYSHQLKSPWSQPVRIQQYTCNHEIVWMPGSFAESVGVTFSQDEVFKGVFADTVDPDAVLNVHDRWGESHTFLIASFITFFVTSFVIKPKVRPTKRNVWRSVDNCRNVFDELWPRGLPFRGRPVFDFVVMCVAGFVSL